MIFDIKKCLHLEPMKFKSMYEHLLNIILRIWFKKRYKKIACFFTVPYFSGRVLKFCTNFKIFVLTYYLINFHFYFIVRRTVKKKKILKELNNATDVFVTAERKQNCTFIDFLIKFLILKLYDVTYFKSYNFHINL